MNTTTTFPLLNAINELETHFDFQAIAKAKLQETGLPTVRDEAWRFTDIRALNQLDLPVASADTEFEDTDKWWSKGIVNAVTVPYVNGDFDINAKLPEGVKLYTCNTAPEELKSQIGSALTDDKTPFVDLNHVLAKKVMILHVSKNADVSRVIHIKGITSADVQVHPRILVIAESFSRVQIVETWQGPAASRYLVNPLSEFVVNAGAIVSHTKLQDDSKTAFHIASIFVKQYGDSQYINHAVQFGAHVGRNDIVAELAASNSVCTLNGLYLPTAKQIHDTHSLVHHAMPHCESHELYKGALSEKGQGVFNGAIYVHKDAQKTNAYQTNRALLLSDNAKVNTKPQLEIYADDVRCSHGATIGQLDKQAMFYLQSRGLDPEVAKAMLTVAFTAEAIADMPEVELRDVIDDMLIEHFSN